MDIGPVIKIISHDLRGPLGNLKSVVTLFKSGELQMEQAKQFMEHIEIGVDKSIVMLDELIEWGSASTKSTLKLEEGTDSNEVIEEVIAMLNEMASNKSQTIAFEKKGNSLAAINKSALKTILRNMITNAIKFTEPEGSIKLEVEDSSDEVIISVIDNGIGVPDEISDAIFGLSKDNRRLGTAEEKGPGIGLFICGDIAERNSGRIWLEKGQVEKGSVFKLSVKRYSSE